MAMSSHEQSCCLAHFSKGINGLITTPLSCGSFFSTIIVMARWKKEGMMQLIFSLHVRPTMWDETDCVQSRCQLHMNNNMTGDDRWWQNLYSFTVEESNQNPLTAQMPTVIFKPSDCRLSHSETIMGTVGKLCLFLRSEGVLIIKAVSVWEDFRGILWL